MSDDQSPQTDSGKGFMSERRNGGIRIRPDLAGILLIFLVHIFCIAWWASKTTTRVDHLEESDAQSVMEYKAIRDTQIEMLTEMAKLTQAMTDRGLIEADGGGSL